MDKKVKFEKPVFYAQNAGEGSFAAGCPSNTGMFNSYSSMTQGPSTMCLQKCRACATSV